MIPIISCHIVYTQPKQALSFRANPVTHVSFQPLLWHLSFWIPPAVNLLGHLSRNFIPVPLGLDQHIPHGNMMQHVTSSTKTFETNDYSLFNSGFQQLPYKTYITPHLPSSCLALRRNQLSEALLINFPPLLATVGGIVRHTNVQLQHCHEAQWRGHSN